MLVKFSPNQRTRMKSRRCWHVQRQLQLPSCCMWFTQSDVAAILSPTCHTPQSNTWTNTWHLHWSSELVTNRMGKLLQIPFGQLRSFRHTLYIQHRLKRPAARCHGVLDSYGGCSAQRAQLVAFQLSAVKLGSSLDTPGLTLPTARHFYCQLFTSHQS